MTGSARTIINELRRLDACAKLAKRGPEFDILGKAANQLEFYLDDQAKLKERIKGQRLLITSLHAAIKRLKAAKDTPKPA